jgi:membrane associated rhomboid family serine protease
VYYFYWIPIGMDARTRRTPWATILLVALNVAVWLWFSTGPGSAEQFLALGFKADDPTLLTLFTSSFLHASFLHLAGNMVYLAALGPALETRMGSGRYLLAYVGCGGLGDLGQAAWVLHFNPGMGSMPIVGASAAISGLLGLILVRLYFARIRFASVTMLLLHGIVKPARFALPAVVALGLWFALEVVYLLAARASEVATMAHLSSLVFGAGLGVLMGMTGEARLERLAVRGSRYADRAEWFAALGEYDSYLSKRPGDPEVLAQAARVHRVTHQDAQALRRFRAAVRAYLAGGDVRAAGEVYEEMRRLLGEESTVAAPDLLRLARGLEEEGRPGDASRVYEAYGRRYPEEPGAPAALLKSAAIEETRLNNPARARFLYHELLARPLTPEFEHVARVRAREAERALDRQRREVAVPVTAGNSTPPAP